MAATDHLTLNAQLELGRRSGPDGHSFNLRLVDTASRCAIVEVNVDPAQLVLAISGVVGEPVAAKVWPAALAKLGLHRENISEPLPLTEHELHELTGADDIGPDIAAMVQTVMPELYAHGWRPFNTTGRFNRHRWTKDHEQLGGMAGTYLVHLERWVADDGTVVSR